MKKMFTFALYMIAGIALNSLPLYAGEMSNDELIKELRDMKSRIEKLELSLAQKESEIEEYKKETGVDKEKTETEGPSAGPGWLDRIDLSGLIEVETSHESMDYNDPLKANENSGDISLATVEIGMDVGITEHVSGHILLLWEEDVTEPIDIDEAYISIQVGERVPLYLNAGKMYVPFGSFESCFISYPLTLEIGETRESAIKAGFANDVFDISLSVFNGDIDELTGNDKVETWVGSAVFTLPEDAFPGLGLILGISCISNIAESDGLGGKIAAGAVNDYVPGLGLFVNAMIMDRFFIGAEYLGATDRFAPGELSFDSGLSYKPRTYNLEFAWAFNDDWELGVKYEGGDDLGDFLPERQYGLVLSYGIFKNTSLGIEFLQGEFENDDERDLVTAQIAFDF